MSQNAPNAVIRELSHEELVERYASLVRRIAYQLLHRLPSHIQVEDLQQAGMIGLLEAARNYDPSPGASFETYAGIRIRGAMLDEVRKTDWTPRSVHRRAREASEAIRWIENAEGRDARDAEVAERLGVSLEEYHHVLQDAAKAHLLSIDDLAGTDGDIQAGDTGGPFESFARTRFRQSLIEAIAGLPEREHQVISLYYNEGLSLREIGERLGVTESRVCQIRGQATLRLRARLAEWVEADTGPSG